VGSLGERLAVFDEWPSATTCSDKVPDTSFLPVYSAS